MADRDRASDTGRTARNGERGDFVVCDCEEFMASTPPPWSVQTNGTPRP